MTWQDVVLISVAIVVLGPIVVPFALIAVLLAAGAAVALVGNALDALGRYKRKMLR